MIGSGSSKLMIGEEGMPILDGVSFLRGEDIAPMIIVRDFSAFRIEIVIARFIEVVDRFTLHVGLKIFSRDTNNDSIDSILRFSSRDTVKHTSI
jgi:hypothetical protein